MLAPFLLSLLTQIPGQRSPIDPGLDAAQPSPHFRALLVGCNAYGKSIGSVNGDRDAERLAIALKRTLGVADAQVHVLVGPAATKARVLHEIDEWLVRGAARGDSVFFGFSGLGTQVLDASGKVIEPALLPIDARRIKPRTGDAEADSDVDPGSVILAKDLRTRVDKLAQVGASVVTLAFDCGAVYDGDAAIRGLRNLKAAHNPAIDRAITGGLKPSLTTLADELSGPNVAAISAGPYAYEGVDGGNLSLAMMLAMNRLAARVAYAPGSLQNLPTFGEGLDLIDAEMPALPQQMPQTPEFGGDRRLSWLGLPLKAPDPTPGVALRKGTGNEPSIWMQEGFVSGVRVGASVSLYLWPNAPRLPGLPRLYMARDISSANPAAIARGRVVRVEDDESEIELNPVDDRRLQQLGQFATSASSLKDVRKVSIWPYVHAVIESGVQCLRLRTILGPSKVSPLPTLSYVVTAESEFDTVLVAPDALPAQPSDRLFPAQAGQWTVYDSAANLIGTVDASIDLISRQIRLRNIFEDLARRQVVLSLLPEGRPEIVVEMQLQPVRVGPESDRFPILELLDVGKSSASMGPDDRFLIRVSARFTPGSPISAPLSVPYVSVLKAMPRARVGLMWPKFTSSSPLGTRLTPDGRWYYLGANDTLLDETSWKLAAVWTVAPEDGEGTEVVKLMATPHPESFDFLRSGYTLPSSDPSNPAFLSLAQSFPSWWRKLGLGGVWSSWSSANLTIAVHR